MFVHKISDVSAKLHNVIMHEHSYFAVILCSNSSARTCQKSQHVYILLSRALRVNIVLSGFMMKKNIHSRYERSDKYKSEFI